MLQEIKFDPGVYVDDSALVAKGRYVAANNIRFVRGLPELRYGNEKFSQTVLQGMARGIHGWEDNSGLSYLAVGTHLRLYASDQDGEVFDITPVVAYGILTNPFTTTMSSQTITVAHSAHGLVSNALVQLPYLTGTINGATITNATRYPVAVIDANTYSFQADIAATSGGAATNGTVDYRYGLNPGLQDGIGGGGYGVGAYGSGAYDSPASGITLYPRTWSFAYWGQNVISNPRGAGIFEWAPNFTASELVNNAQFTAPTGWTVGTGWSVGGGNANASATNAAITQTITLDTAAWHLLHVVGTITTGQFQVTVNNVAVITGSANGHFNQPFFSGVGGAQVLAITGSALSGNLSMSSVQVLTTAQQILPSAPTVATCIFTTSERILVACGINDQNGIYQPMEVGWTDEQNNESWTATASNLAGSYPLTSGSRIVRGLPGNGENLIWTDTSFYAMRYVPDPNVVYDFVEIGPGCGLIGPNAVCVVNGTAFWKAPNGQDYYYNGGPPTPIPSNTMRHDFTNNLAWVQQDKIFSASINSWNEIQHIYPDLRDGLGGSGGIECSRYNKHNFTDDVWDPGTTQFTCWLDQGVFQYPIGVDTSGYIRYCEKGNSIDGSTLTGTLTSAKFKMGDGDQLITVLGMAADTSALMGGYSINFIMSSEDVRGIRSKTFGPYNFNAASGRVSIRAKGEMAQMQWNFSGSPMFWRQGTLRLDMQSAGDRR